ncbi:CBS domain-containing protein [Thalassobacillus pellis]|uniref:CBS domain-containing protein n=1 Tax=Thalassobacillus pellis TaxID=748008 RepID=UPI001EF97D81|nr:CBS domain-containing protein [Thalassobacillus pellis]MBM7551722.1 putative transcriptional regulator [Thalassobacillus pellis]
MNESRYGMELAEHFEIAFNQIHQTLKSINGYPKNDNFMELVQRSKVQHSVIRHHFDHLKQFAKLRNAIVHEKIRDDYYIAYPHKDVVETIEKIKQTLDQPPLALDMATKPVLFFRSDSHLTKILEAFSRFKVSQFPIYGENHEFLGLLTNDGVVRWLSRNMNQDCIQLGEVRAADILPLEKNHNVRFLSEKNSIFDLEAFFSQSFKQNLKLKAVLITEGGAPDGKPIGIVTTWDLIKIDRDSQGG